MTRIAFNVNIVLIDGIESNHFPIELSLEHLIELFIEFLTELQRNYPRNEWSSLKLRPIKWAALELKFGDLFFT